MESPVFAFPLLLRTEPRVEDLFTFSFSWNFECSQCGHTYQNRSGFCERQSPRCLPGKVEVLEAVPGSLGAVALASRQRWQLLCALPASWRGASLPAERGPPACVFSVTS